MLEKIDIQVDIVNRVAFKANFHEVKKQLEDGLKAFNIEVNEDNFNQAEQSEKQLQRLSKLIDKKRLDCKKEMLVPIDEFENLCKELKGLVDNANLKIKKQTEEFKEKRKQTRVSLIRKELEDQYKLQEVSQEFKTVNLDNLAENKTAFTDTGALTKDTKQQIFNAVLSQKNMQLKVENRLNILSQKSTEKGLISPLVRSDIEGFLKEQNDEVFNTKLETLCNQELVKQERIKKAQEEQIKAEYEAKIKEAEKNALKSTATTEAVKIEPQNTQTPDLFQVLNSTFQVEIEGKASISEIQNALKAFKIISVKQV